jgi:hypothetical protein
MNDQNIEGMIQRQPRRVELKDTQPVVCDNCQGNVFAVGVFMRRVSALMTGTGKASYLPIENAVYCVKCGHCNAEFIPDQLKNSSLLST